MTTYIEKNRELLNKAENLSSKFSIDLPSFYKDKVEIRDEFNFAEKVPYDELCDADYEEAHNGFIMIVQDLQSAIDVLDSYDGDINAWTDDFGGTKDLLDSVEYGFNHICKWIAQKK